MKKKVYILLILVVVVVGSVSGALIYNNKSFKNITTKKFNELLSNTDEKLVYIGRPTCPGCAELKPILEEKLDEAGIKAYYYNTDKAKKESMDTFNKIKEDLSITSVPVVIIYDGENEVARLEHSEYKADEESLDNIIEEYKSKVE